MNSPKKKASGIGAILLILAGLIALNAAAAFGPNVIAGLPNSNASPAAMLENVTKQCTSCARAISIVLSLTLDARVCLSRVITGRSVYFFISSCVFCNHSSRLISYKFKSF